jgi:GrpB-like predicted nucleotidyltransferase (UPF0157 family)
MPSAEEITRHIDDDPDGVEWINAAQREPLEIVDADPAWTTQFDALADRIHRALADHALCVEHVGSTSVAGLAAKPVIDIDLTVADPDGEFAYVPALTAAGFRLRLRERGWHEHRLLQAGPASQRPRVRA